MVLKTKLRALDLRLRLNSSVAFLSRQLKAFFVWRDPDLRILKTTRVKLRLVFSNEMVRVSLLSAYGISFICSSYIPTTLVQEPSALLYPSKVAIEKPSIPAKLGYYYIPAKLGCNRNTANLSVQGPRSPG